MALLVSARANAAPAAVGQATTAASATIRWQARGEGLGAQAAWLAPSGDAGVIMQCDRGDPRVLLRIDASILPDELQQVTLIADGIGMEYPLERTTAGGYRSKIALDAPILDRMLLARSFTLYGGGRAVRTGVPGDALARVVRTCRELHWPRDARIDPSDAGLAKK
ncbi:hypothetical protein [Lysobacter claricitrinus]|uniref:hypothetical protein n=1 Tax=Lysobacter claricitrinus TaxID=3367728 RepID=UPI0037DB63A1